jgi:ketosteroid isomerase-like protein
VDGLASLYSEDAVNHQVAEAPVEGRIAFQRGYWDKLTFLRQHGLPIPQD